MGTMTILHQDAVRRHAHSMEQIEKGISNIQKNVKDTASKKDYEKQYKKTLEYELSSVFDDEFSTGRKYSFNIETTYNNFLRIDLRNKTINKVASNTIDAMSLDDMYVKILNKVYRKYQDDEKARQFERAKQEEMLLQQRKDEYNERIMQNYLECEEKQAKKENILFILMIVITLSTLAWFASIFRWICGNDFPWVLSCLNGLVWLTLYILTKIKENY